MTSDFIHKLTDIVGAKAIKFDEPMKQHTTFRIGGPADIYVVPENAKALAKAVECCKAFDISWMIIGNGSNLLVGDKGIRGVVFQIFQTMDAVDIHPVGDGYDVTAGAGILLSRLARTLLAESLCGFEFASGIPGTLGGAVAMNAGAYGGEMTQVLVSARVLTAQGQVRTLSHDELQLGYRTSVILREGMIVLEATMHFKKGNKEDILALMDDFNGRRRDKQPLEWPSAGSTFKRPAGYFAGKLIEDAKLKGFCIGGAQVSEKHSGFVINKGDATAQDVLKLIEHVQQVVKEQFHVMLEPEVRIIGDF